MGQFRVVIEGVGGHGCARRPKDGESIKYEGCGSMRCPDCLARELVEKYQRLGIFDLKAKFTHWPDTPEQVVDDLVENVRHGSFT